MEIYKYPMGYFDNDEELPSTLNVEEETKDLETQKELV
jgi:hypothetical protein